MKEWTKAIGVIVTAALAALCLAACGSSSGASESASGSSAESAMGNVADIVSSGASNSSAVDSDDGSIYVVKHAKYYGSIDGESYLSSEIDYEYDEHGNNTKMTAVDTDPTTKESTTTWWAWSDFDSNGYPGKYESSDGNASTTEWTIEDGHAVKAVSSDGSTTELTYYDDGKVKSQVTTYDNNRRITVDYDDNGCPVSQVMEDAENPQKTEWAWTLDDDGRIESVTITSTKEDTKETFSNEYTVEYDENDNIAAVYWSDGALMRELEYQKIDNPSVYAWIKSQSPNI